MEGNINTEFYWYLLIQSLKIPIGSDDVFSATQKKGGRKNPKMKQHKETILVTAVQAAENKKKKKQQNAGFMYGNVADEEEKTA